MNALPPPVSAPPAAEDADDVCRTEAEVEMKRLINVLRERENQERARRGEPPLPMLTASAKLQRSARRWAGIMARSGEVAHKIGSVDWAENMKRERYPNSWTGQVVCAGGSEPHPADAVGMWRRSPGHLEALLGRDYRECGCALVVPEQPAVYRWMACVDLGGAETRRAPRCKEDAS
jgi:uncharacterized protein YkwD